MASIQTSETQRVKGIFNCANMPGETASLNNTTGRMCDALRIMFTAHQEEQRANEGKKPSSPWSACPPALCKLFVAEQQRRRRAAQAEAKRRDSAAKCCKSG